MGTKSQTKSPQNVGLSTSDNIASRIGLRPPETLAAPAAAFIVIPRLQARGPGGRGWTPPQRLSIGYRS